ncbi:MAG: PCRF domain-containing protein, partial [Betaproteobacteria bacterium]|nr:PCRF domain-containing protein [Betaproteobacteria bacterium]
MKASLLKRLTALDARLSELDRLLADPDVTRDLDQYRKLTREHAEIAPVTALFQQHRAAEADLAAARDMAADPELRAFA